MDIRKKRRTVRIEDVAQEAGVSITTVSFVFNRRERVSEETARRVLEAAKRLNYHPSEAGRSLALRQSRTLGLLLPSATQVSDQFFATFLSGLTNALESFQYHLTLLSPGHSAEETKDLLVRSVQSSRVDGFILMEVEPDDPRVRFLYSSGVPFALFGRSELPVPWVDVDNYHGGMVVTNYLLSLGHRRIGHIAAPGKYLYARLRRQGYEDALKQAGQKEGTPLVPLVVEGDLTARSAYEVAKQWLTSGHRPTAIFAASDVMAEGVLQCAKELGIEVPRQLSVVGFDDTKLATQTRPELTSVSQNPYRIGERVAAFIVQFIESGRIEHELVTPVLKERQSAASLMQYEAPATSLDQPRLKSGPSFSLWSDEGSIQAGSLSQGVFCADTRFVSQYEFRCDGRVPTPIQRNCTRDRLTLKYVIRGQSTSLCITRTIDMKPDRFEDRWEWCRYGESAQPYTLELHVAPDFRDVFELRGAIVASHGRIDADHSPTEDNYRYHGLDHVVRSLRVLVSLRPTESSQGTRKWIMPPEQRSGSLTVVVSWSNPLANSWVSGVAADGGLQSWPKIETGSPEWNSVLSQSVEDVQMLLTDFGYGEVLMAGLPWYGTLFGRDAIIGALQTLWFAPRIAESTLATLSAFQGQTVSQVREEEPGKIIHEVRVGELANLDQIPFGRYYGSIDSTPLFLTLLASTWKRTGSRDLIERYRVNMELALRWLDSAGRASGGDGLYRFRPVAENGLVVQSWKDSPDSMVYSSGQFAKPPLAVAEVQGYVYQAKMGMAELFDFLGECERAEQLRQEAAQLQDRFHTVFWMQDRQYYAMAVDSLGQRLDVLSSDAGQCLWTGIIPQPYRGVVVSGLMAPQLFSGWGIRTLAAGEAAYDPFSYHRGSVWPHDTSLIVAGMAESDFTSEAAVIAKGLMDAAAWFPGRRLPELFSGVPREEGPPVPYPEACAPQAWAAAAPLLLVQSLLGLRVDAVTRKITMNPVIPEEVGWIRVSHLSLSFGEWFSFRAQPGRVWVEELPASWKLTVGGAEVVWPEASPSGGISSSR